MKKLIVINGPMGVGKTTLSKELLNQRSKAVWLDGDWCWMMNPWNFSEENRDMVIDNISYILKNYLINCSFEFVILSWVINKTEILNSILERLEGLEFDLRIFSLSCTQECLRKRLLERGNDEEVIKRAIEMLGDYTFITSTFIDTEKSIEENLCIINSLID